MLNTFLNPRVLIGLAVALVVGLIFGAFIGWRIPVSDLSPVDLHPGFRNFYLETVAEQYSLTHDLDQAKRMLSADNPGDVHRWSSKEITAELRKLATSPSANKDQLNALADALEKPTTPVKAAPGPNWTLIFLGVLALLAVVAIGAVLILPRLRGEQAGAPRPQAVAVRSALASKAVEPTDTWAGEADKPLAQFVTTYEIGDDRYDTSFSIETATGDFLGECGVGIGETIGVGNPDKVTAFEVWLFDKNDIRTVTKVLMSEYAYGDQALRTKLAPKGEPELARPEAALELETASLKVRARVVEMDYGSGELQPRSFFNKVVLELAAWPKGASVPVA
jgi:uncharacterized protein YneF (UPF0154 family)